MSLLRGKVEFEPGKMLDAEKRPKQRPGGLSLSREDWPGWNKCVSRMGKNKLWAIEWDKNAKYLFKPLLDAY